RYRTSPVMPPLALHDALPIWTVWNNQGRVTQASEHNGTEQRTLDASVAPSVAPRLESASTLSAPEPGANSSRNGSTARAPQLLTDRKSTRLNSSHVKISYAVF